MSLVIRLADDKDRDALIEHTQLLNQHEDSLAHNRRIDRDGAEDTLAASEDRINRTGGVKLVAELAGRVVGHLFLTFEEAPSYVRNELRPFAYIDRLFVIEELRGKGIGRSLMKHAEKIALERGYRQMSIGLLSGNVLAENAYVRFGFLPYSLGLLKKLG